MSRFCVSCMAALLVTLSSCGHAERDSDDGEIYSHLGADFELTDHRGRPFRLSEQEGVSLLFFGFTSCPDVCPLTMSRLASLMKDVPADKVSVLFVSVDPRRDTPERLAQYGASYDFRFIGLTSEDPSRIPPIARAFAAGLQRTSEGTIDHSSRIYLLDSQHRVRDVFASDDDTAHMAEVIGSVID
ncbi:MAG: SCO family protein [Candidatus Latescibacterota bacterium]|nr:SCO family protein [Candidatus Latescibacterota bacterium]